MQMGKQGMHRRSPWSGRTANGVPDANDTITDVAAGQRLFIIVSHRTSVSDQPVMITQLKGASESEQRLKDKLRQPPPI
jgi:hypothetical protein